MEKNLFGLPLKELENILTDLEEPKFRAKQLYNWLYKKNIIDLDLMLNISKNLKEKLKTDFKITLPTIFKISKSESENSYKFLLQTEDENLIESVLMITEEHATICVSSMIGCPLKCAFCATGCELDFKRNLTSGEIIAQVFILKKYALENKLAPKITNIVFMGMGEPLLNMENLKSSLEILLSEEGFGFPHTKITISTAGITDKIRYIVEKFRIRLAVSLHFVNDTVRSQFMPVNRRFPLKNLINTLKNIELSSKRDFITIEYMMINNVNDSPEDARLLAGILEGMPVKINLIPLNPTKNFNEEPSSEENINRFVKFLWEKKIVTTVRRSKGKDINGACGQLALKR